MFECPGVVRKWIDDIMRFLALLLLCLAFDGADKGKYKI